MSAELVPFEVLQETTGYKRLADVERCLTAGRIRYFRGKDGVWTTLALINAAGGLSEPSAANDAYPAEKAT